MRPFLFFSNFLFFTAFQFSPESFRSYSQAMGGSDYSITMIPIEGDVYQMGSPPDEPGRSTDEAPVRNVEVRDFWMSQMEISWDVYELFLYREIDNISQSKGNVDLEIDGISGATMPYVNINKPGYPVINITQYAASQFCKWLTAKTGYYYRLPTEAEWEYACRAGTQGAYSFIKDDLFLDDIAWYKGNSDDHYQKSGLKKPNDFGLFDMHGNVAEWVLDHYNPEGYSSNLTFTRGTKLYPKVIRGGSFRDLPERLRSAARGFSEKAWKKQDPQSPKSLWWHTDAPHIGFRIVRPKSVPFRDQMEKYWIKPIKEY